MSDPFRANSNSQLIREAQIAFVVIGALLCVLVYVAFHRVSGRKYRFQQISKKAPVAENVADVPYPAQVLIEREEDAVQNAFDTVSALTDPQLDPNSAAKSSATEKQSTPKVTTFEALPVTELSTAAVAPVVAMPSVAQANFIDESASEKKLDDDDSFEKVQSFEPMKPFKPFTPLPKPTKPVPEKVSPIGPRPADQVPPSNENDRSEKPFSGDAETSFKPPAIKSNFGSSIARRPSSFEPATDLKAASESKTGSSRQRPAMDRFTSAVSANETASPAGNEFAKAESTTPKSFMASPKQQTPEPFQTTTKDQISPELNGYEVQPDDSLWSIATEKYGDGRFFRALHQHNHQRIASVEQLQPHTTILIPELAELKKLYPGLCPADQLRSDVDPQDSLAAEYELREQRMNDRYYVTQSGDTLFDVARQKLGQASRYLEIYDLNQFRIPEQVNHLTPLKPGLRLLLPE